MKRMKKATALLLVLVLTMALSVSVFAAEIPTVDVSTSTTNGTMIDDGKIMISGIHTDSLGNADTVYTLYKMLHLESYTVNGENGATEDAYSYVIVDKWKDFFTSNSVATHYISISDSGYVSWPGNKTADDLNAFASAALAYAKANGIAPVMTSATPYTGTPLMHDEHGYKIEGTNGTFHGLTLGYYLIDSNVGILCGLTTPNRTATVNAKNGSPTMDKQVEEDSLAESGTASWGESNTADVGQVVKYDVTITAHNGAETYIFHDTMSSGLTFDETSLKVYYDDADDPAPKTTLTEGTHYTLVTAPIDGCTFEIKFTQTFLNTLHTNDQIILTYEALLNKNALIGGANTNDAYLEYGEGHKTTHDITTTFTYGFDLVKTNSASKLISGAEFKLYPTNACTAGTELWFVYDTITKTYRLATTNDDPADTTNTLVVEGGKVSVHGLDNARYYLQEIVAPTGYNKLDDPIEVGIKDRYRDAVVTDDHLVGGTNPVQVINNTGSVLPSTGGMGTTLFITIGMIAVLGTGVLLVTKKRMGMIQD